MRIKQARNLSAIQFIHGSLMRSIDRNIYQNQQFQSKITSAQSQTTYLVIGYFYLSQVITTPLPLITIAILQENYNFLNLYIVDDSTLELKYIHDSNNVVSTINQSVQTLQNTWISLGIVYSKTSSVAYFTYSNAQSQLILSQPIQNSYLPSSVQTLDICISCIFQGGVFGQFIGKFSTVKIIFDIDIIQMNNYYFFNEATEINKDIILDSSFNILSYEQNSEYNINQGFDCDNGYAFFEGVCIKNSNCQNLVYEADILQSFEVGKFYDSTTKKCINCGDNCIQCISNSNCISCRPGFISSQGKCLRCNNTTHCNSSCSGQQIFDEISQTCINQFKAFSHSIQNPLLSNRMMNDNSEIQVNPSLAIENQIVHCYIDFNNNPMTIHSFLGGIQFTASTILSYQWTKIPSGYQKSVSFYVLFYGGGNPSNLQVYINSNISQLESSSIVSSQTKCSGSLSLILQVFKVQYSIKDYQKIFNLEIKNTSSGWGLRNMSIELLKCHPTCNSCFEGGKGNNCTSCSSNFTRNRFQCVCQKGFYAKYQNCFDSQCAFCTQCQVSNCLQCEDITGNCTLCQSGFVIQDGLCIQESDCSGDLKVLFENSCGLTKEIAVQHLQSNKIVQYADYWKFFNNNITTSPCFTSKCMPLLYCNESHTLQITLNNIKSYHQFLNVTFDVFVQQLSHYGGFTITINNNQILSRFYTYIISYLTNNKLFQKEYLKIPLDSNNQYIRFRSEAEYGQYSFKDVIFFVERCHPLCKTCSDITLKSCILCIDNAEKIDGICQCKEGFYFQLVTLPTGQDFPGKCLQCDDSCKTCTGPSYYECTYCQDGYQDINNVCQYKCEENQYWDQNKNSCINCHTCCRTCKSDQINGCHDCQKGFNLNLQDHTCMINNSLCQICSVAINSICGGNIEIHNDCIKNYWVVLNSNICVNCGLYSNNFCGGDQSEEVIHICKEKGYFNHDNQNCTSCQNVVSNTCGRSEIKDICSNNGWIVKNNLTCINCSRFVNGFCGGDLTQNDIKLCYKYGFFNYDSTNCSSCTEVVQQNCGRSEIKDRCNDNQWEVLDQSTCFSCNTFVNGKCGVKSNQKGIDLCEQKGFFNYDENNCSSCSNVSFDKCGRNEIQERCFNNNWYLYGLNQCINCNPNSQSFSDCVCDNTCLTCSRYFNSQKCTSCKPNLYLFQSECLTKCPNGFIANQQKCDPCSDLQMPNCINCFKTCQKCNPFEISQFPDLCISCSTQTRYLQQGECKCLDPEDNRQIFHECSYQSIAVLNPIISNTDKVLSIDFGKELNKLSAFQQNTFSQLLCLYLFSSSTLKLFGSIYECSIFKNQVFVNFDTDSLLFNGDLIYFNQNILSFQTSPSIIISKYINNMVIQQQLVGNPKVEFIYQQTYNSCDNIYIVFSQIINGLQRGFQNFKWSLIAFEPFDLTYQTILENTLYNANNEKNLNLLILKGIIKPGTKVIIKFDYTLKVNYINNIQFSFSVKLEKKISLDIQNTIIYPFYRYNSGIIVITPSVKTCLPSGDMISNEPINLKIKTQNIPEINVIIQSELEYYYIFELYPYQFQVGIINFNVKSNIQSDSEFQTQVDFKFQVVESKLYVKLIGGNGYFDFQKNIIIKGKFRDYDIKNEDDPHEIKIYWQCIDLNHQIPCVNRIGDLVDFTSFKETATLQANTFDPYNVIQIVLLGEKNNRKANDTINLFISELDLPPLKVKITINDLLQETVNLNDEIFVEIDYLSSVNKNLLSFSGAILYENEIVGIIKIDYSRFRFKIQDYKSDFKKDLSEIELKISAFNPKYYMSTSNVQILTLNLSPKNCKLIAIPNSFVIALETQVLLMFQDCQDQNQPLQYQFFYYKNQLDFEYERINPNKVKRRQITDKQQSNMIQTILPSGQIIILAQSIDSKNAIYNTTIKINVEQKKYSEQLYLQMAQQKIDQIQNIQTGKAISELSILCDDFLQRSELKSSSSINNKFIDISNIIIFLQKKLSPISTFSTSVDKAIESLTVSGIYFNQNEQDILGYLIQTLDYYSNLQELNQDISRENLKQKIYDIFLVIDSLANPEIYIDKLIQIIRRIGLYSFKIILPNEDAIYYQGNTMSILVRQITEKYICSYFICEYQTEVISNSTQPKIYDFTLSKFNKNPYSQDTKFLNYTNSLNNGVQNQTIIQYPLVTPSIYNYEQSSNNEKFSKNIAINIQNLSEDQIQKKMICVSKEDDSIEWTKSRCESSYNDEQKSYQCICESLSPTTIIQDVEDIIEDSNINVIVSEEGISNIMNFNDFHKYIIVLIYLSFVGFLLDRSTSISKLTQPQTDTQQLENTQHKTLPIKSNKIFPSTQIPDKINNIDKKKNNISKQLSQQNETYYDSPNSIQPSQRNENIFLKDNDDFVLELNTEQYIFQNQQVQSPVKMASINNQQIAPLSPALSPAKRRQSRITLIQSPRMESIIKKNEELKIQIAQQENKQNQMPQLKLDQPKNEFEQYQKLSPFIQLLVFHNFFQIFYLYNPIVSRKLRFLIFYIRSIHSLCISQIFDKQYSVVQKLITTAINSILMILIIKILEKVFNFTTKFQKYKSITILTLIMSGYYYMIIAIASGESSDESNKFIGTFSLFYFGDIFLFSFIFSQLQRICMSLIMKNKISSGIKKQLYKLMELDLILQSIDHD